MHSLINFFFFRIVLFQQKIWEVQNGVQNGVQKGVPEMGVHVLSTPTYYNIL